MLHLKDISVMMSSMSVAVADATLYADRIIYIKHSQARGSRVRSGAEVGMGKQI